MASIRKLPSDDVLLKLARDEGLSNKDIAVKYGTTGEAVRQALAKVGFRRQPERPSHARYLPWVLRADHVGDMLARRLRMLSKREQGRPMTDSENRMLDDWLAFMEGNNSYGVPLSVHYDRNDPQGFWLEPRRSGDRDFIHPPA